MIEKILFHNDSSTYSKNPLKLVKKVNFFLVLPIIFSIILISSVTPADAQDIAKIMAEKYSLDVDEQTFDIFYGFKGSLEVDISNQDVDNPKASQMILNKEKKSLEINLEEHEYAGPMWVRLPTQLITAQGGEFQLFIDDVDKPFELTYYANEISVGFFLSEGTEKVEIIGTSVIPEFSTIAVLVLGTGMTSLIILTQKTSFN